MGLEGGWLGSEDPLASADSVLFLPLPKSLVSEVFVQVELGDVFDGILKLVGVLLQVEDVLQGFSQVFLNFIARDSESLEQVL